MCACSTDSSGSAFLATGTCICWRELHDWHCIMQYLNTCNRLVSNENAVIWTGVSAEENCGIDIAQCSNLNTCNTHVKWKCSHLNKRQSPAHFSRQISDYWVFHSYHVISAAYCFKLHVHLFVKCFLQHTVSVYTCCIKCIVFCSSWVV